MFVLLVLVMTHASPALSQETSTVRVSNLGVEPESQIGMDNGQMNAHSFHTGDTAVTLEKVRMYARTVRPDPPPVVTIRADDSGQPGSTLLTLTTPTFGKSTGPIPLDFTTTGFQLAADTTYWVVVLRPWNNDFAPAISFSPLLHRVVGPLEKLVGLWAKLYSMLRAPTGIGK